MSAARAATMTGERPPGTSVARDTAVVSGLNLASRVTGLARVVAMSAALGATALGDTYQSANLVSNILFELLAGGLLSAVLVPTFVDLVDRGRRSEAARLAGLILGAALAVLTVVVVGGVLLGPWLMRLLTLGVPDAEGRDQQVELGTFLLWFFLPQVLLYAVGAVATALLHAERRFVAAALAPVCNNVVVIVAMIAFVAIRQGDTSLPLSLGERLVLAAGATGGVLAMSLVPVVAVRLRGLHLRPRWPGRDPAVRSLLGRGAWAALQLAVTQVLALVTIVLANGVSGGVVAYQVAFTFFLLPYALLAQPLTTALFPRLSTSAAAGRLGEFGRDLSTGLRTLVVVLVPASALGAALARPLVEVLRFGALDAAGADLVAAALAAYSIGLAGYAAFLLLTRAAYAVHDVRSPAVILLTTTAIAVVAMVLVLDAASITGTGRVVVLGLGHGAAVTAGAVVLWRRMDHAAADAAVRLEPLRRAIAVAVAAGLAGGLAAAFVVGLVGFEDRGAAVAAVIGGGVAGTAVVVVVLALLGGPELRALRNRGREWAR